MDRKQLLNVLGTVRPALATSSLVQVLTHLCFSEREVLAYNDQIGISAPLSAGFSGAVPGTTLLAMLGASRARDVEFAAAADKLSVRAGGAKIALSLSPPESFLFSMPKLAGDPLPVSSEGFVEAVRGCLRSVSPDTSVPDQLGVTLIPKKKSVEMYSINGASMSMARVPLSGPQTVRRRVVVAAPFCEQMVRLAGGGKKAALAAADDHALLRTASGVRLFGKLVDVPKPLDFEGLFSEIVPADLDARSAEIPKTLPLAVERAVIASDPSGERVYSQLTVTGGVGELATKSGQGRVQVTDRFKLPAHPDVAVSVDARWLKVGCAAFDRVLVTERAVVFGRAGSLYLVATMSA